MIEPSLSLRSRIGRFKLKSVFFAEPDMRTVISLMKYMVVCQTESIEEGDSCIYTAYSPLFEILAPGEEIPTYEIRMSSLSGVVLNVRAIRIPYETTR